MSPRLNPVQRTLAGPLVALGIAAASGTAAHAQDVAAEPAPAPAEDRPVIKSVFASGSVSFVDLRGKDGVWSLANAGIVVNTSSTGTTTAEVQRTARPGLENWRGSVRHEEQLSKDTRAYVRLAASTGDPLREDWGVAQAFPSASARLSSLPSTGTSHAIRRVYPPE